MKKLLIVALTALILCGCSTGAKSDELDFKDISFNTYFGIDGNRRVMKMDFENNSDFVITDYRFTFSEKDGITDEQRNEYFVKLAEILNLSLDELKQYKYDRIEFSTVYNDNDGLISPGEKRTSNLHYLQGITLVLDENDFNLSIPDIAKIKYIGKDNKEHTTYYDFKTNKQTYED